MRNPADPLVALMERDEVSAIVSAISELIGANAVEKVLKQHQKLYGIEIFSNRLIPNATYVQFLEACARESGQPLLGAMIGHHVAFSDLGDFGAYVVSAPTAYVALARASRALKYHESGSSLSILGSTLTPRILYLPPTPRVLGNWQQCDGALALLVNLVRLYEGPEWKPDLIASVSAHGNRSQLLERFFDAPVKERNAGVEISCSLSGASAATGGRYDHSQPMTFSDLRRLVSKAPQHTLKQQLKVAIAPLVARGECNLHEVAGKLGLGARTLQRQLELEGISFSILMREIRQELALELLIDLNLSIAEVGRRLGYSSTQHFIRAFKNWSGHTPGEHRRQTISCVVENQAS